jgi:hypothetical protein
VSQAETGLHFPLAGEGWGGGRIRSTTLFGKRSCGRAAGPGFRVRARAPRIKLAPPVQLIVGKGYNHYEMGETLGDPYAVMGRAALEMMKLTPA